MVSCGVSGSLSGATPVLLSWPEVRVVSRASFGRQSSQPGSTKGGAEGCHHGFGTGLMHHVIAARNKVEAAPGNCLRSRREFKPTDSALVHYQLHREWPG